MRVPDPTAGTGSSEMRVIWVCLTCKVRSRRSCVKEAECPSYRCSLLAHIHSRRGRSLVARDCCCHPALRPVMLTTRLLQCQPLTTHPVIGSLTSCCCCCYRCLDYHRPLTDSSVTLRHSDVNSHQHYVSSSQCSQRPAVQSSNWRGAALIWNVTVTHERAVIVLADCTTTFTFWQLASQLLSCWTYCMEQSSTPSPSYQWHWSFQAPPQKWKLNYFVEHTSLVLVIAPGRSVNNAIEMTILLLLLLLLLLLQPIGGRTWEIDWYQHEWPWPLFRGRLRSCQSLRHIHHWISRKPLRIQTWFWRTTNRKWPMVNQMDSWPMSSSDP